MGWTEQQEAAITARTARICVDAGAGSGKTRVLVDRIAYLIEQGAAKLEEIVAITFTEKAAAEMKERLRKTFRAKAPADNPEEMNRWRDLERRAETARVCTIHAFCASMLKENAFRLGYDPDFAVLPEADAALMLDEVVTATLHTLLEQGDSAALRLGSEMGFSALKSTLIKLLRRGGLMERVGEAWPLTDAAALQARWAEKAAEERQRRLLALKQANKVNVFLRELRRFSGECSKPEDGREQWRRQIIAALERIPQANSVKAIERLLFQIIEKPSARGSKANWGSEETFKAISKLEGEVERFAKEHVEEDADNPALESAAAELTRDLSAAYEQARSAFDAAKARANGMDFDDLIMAAHRALRNDGDLRRRVASDIRFLLIDEFQDTDGTQLELARLLADEPGGPALFIVGDAKQSIYLFRGAEVEVFHAQRGDSEAVLPLSRNFRSLPDVLGFVNELFARSGLLNAIEPYQPMQTERAAANDTRVAFLVAGPDGASGEKWNAEEYRRAEADLIAARIQAICGGDSPVAVFDEPAKAFRNADYGDVALLFRNMSNVHLYEEALRRAGVPYALVSGAGFYERQEIRDVLNALKVFLDPWDEAALFGFLRGPMARLSDESLMRLCAETRLAAAFQGETVPPGFPQAGQLTAARALVRRFRARVGGPVAALLRELLDDTGFEAALLPQYLGLQKASNVRKLAALAEEFTGFSARSVRAFVNYLGDIGGRVREGEAAVQPEGGGAVTLMTVHKSKGLEFPVVFVPDMGQGRHGPSTEAVFLHRELGLTVKVTDAWGNPAQPAMAKAIAARVKEEEEAEHARLLYVALTRARDCLVMCGGDKPGKGSWFEVLDAEFGMLSKENGASIAGEGWRAQVWRGAGARAVRRTASCAGEAPDFDALCQGAGPVVAAASERKVFSISSILDYLAEGFDPEEERLGDEDAPRISGTAFEAMARGSLIHRMFEEWDFTRDVLPDLEALAAEAGIGLRRQAAVMEDLRRVAGHFRESELWPVVAAASDLLKEAPFFLNAGEALISGTIDALLPEGVIIDYKTGAYSEDRHARYEWQLLLYAAAVRTLLPCVPRMGYLYYADARRCVQVALSEEQIEWALRHAREVITRLRKAGIGG